MSDEIKDADDSKALSSSTKTSGEIKFDFEKSNYFRVIHADGIFGGVTPRGDLHISFFNERLPIPKQTTHGISNTDGQPATVGAEKRDQRISRTGVYREVEVDVVMNITAALSFKEWLENHLKIAMGDIPSNDIPPADKTEATLEK